MSDNTTDKTDLANAVASKAGGGLARFLEVVFGALRGLVHRSSVPDSAPLTGDVGSLGRRVAVSGAPAAETGPESVASTGSGNNDSGMDDGVLPSRPASPGTVVAVVVRWLDLCRPLVKHFESCKLKSYWDATGKCWTIGWGETGADVVEGLEWTQDQADARLDTRLKQCGVMADSAIKVFVTDAEKAAFVSILYNVGPGRAARVGDSGRDGILMLATGVPSTLLHKLNTNDHQGCADQFPLWDKSGGVVLGGLVKRRAAERLLFLTGAWQ